MQGVFLHAGWRTAGTWLWSRLRAQPDVMAFYEPLHEILPNAHARQITAIDPGQWQSRHPTLSAPYFHEYLPLLREHSQPPGVSGALLSFSFDDFFAPATAPNPCLFRYIDSLCKAAEANGQKPVLKFTRSQGRLGWFNHHFPEHTHALMLRQPWRQFLSGWRSFTEDRNPYFLAVPFLVLERNAAAHSHAAALIRALDLPVAPDTSAPMMSRLKYWQHRVRQLPFATMYRGAAAFWGLSTASALPETDFLLDGDSGTKKMAAAFHIHTGTKLDPGRGARETAAPLRVDASTGPISLEEILACHATVQAALEPGLSWSDNAIIAGYLDDAAAKAAADLPRFHHTNLAARRKRPLVFRARAYLGAVSSSRLFR